MRSYAILGRHYGISPAQLMDCPNILVRVMTQVMQETIAQQQEAFDG